MADGLPGSVVAVVSMQGFVRCIVCRAIIESFVCRKFDVVNELDVGTLINFVRMAGSVIGDVKPERATAFAG